MHADQSQFEDVNQVAVQDRRMQVRAYNFWYSLLKGRDFPSIDDLKPTDLKAFASNSVLLDFSKGRDDPALPYVGAALRAQCHVGQEVTHLSDVPAQSLLGLVAMHYDRLIETRTPVGFESANPDDLPDDQPLYRGILMPFSSDGKTIDFVYAVINWKTPDQRAADRAAAEKAAREDEEAFEDLDTPAPLPESSEPLVAAAEDGPDHDDTVVPFDPVSDEADREIEEEEETSDDDTAPFRVDDVSEPEPDDDVEPESVPAGVIAFDPVEPSEDERAADWQAFAELADVDVPQHIVDAPDEEAPSRAQGPFAALSGKFRKMLYHDPLGGITIGADGNALEDDGEQFQPFDEPDEFSSAQDDGFDEPVGAVEAADHATPVEEAAEVQGLQNEDAFDVPEPFAEEVEPADQPAVDEIQDVVPDTIEESHVEAAPEPDPEPAPVELVAVPFVPDEADLDAPESADEFTDAPESLADETAADETDEKPAADLTPALTEWLEAAREAAALSKDADGRSRAALYQALGQAYDFSLVAAEEPEAYAALLEAADLTVQARAPMTPIVKLVFGLDYDKTRLTEFASALNYGHRNGVERGDFERFVSEADGGLKGLVAEERRLKRGEEARPTGPSPRLEKAMRSLRSRDAIDLRAMGANEEFSLVLVRRDETGGHSPVARVLDDRLLERAILKSLD
ncbi:hypothetical protein WJT74_09515 [Sphingomicrobium sp. XHP0239]|uniref:hypothetical protein n=1 Tax=Sphingomicrobium maritimum TaxID=3133972 RepID=UPI0031CC59EF